MALHESHKIPNCQDRCLGQGGGERDPVELLQSQGPLDVDPRFIKGEHCTAQARSPPRAKPVEDDVEARPRAARVAGTLPERARRVCIDITVYGRRPDGLWCLSKYGHHDTTERVREIVPAEFGNEENG